MPIDKLTPRFLVSDKDERLLKEGAMTDALNVTISEDGDGSEGIVKNIKGTDAADPVSGLTLPDNSLKVIGSVSDHQLGKIYFFVADGEAPDVNDPTYPESAIYQYDTSSDEYRLVFKNEWLNFSPNLFVKADVLNGDFQQNGSTQTILYFTDNYNPPRKINVDRALNGDYDSIANLDYALSAIKGAPTAPVSVTFTTDTSISVNNFEGVAFQFALQNIYTDGEESAIGPYSKLAFSDAVPASGLEGDDSGQLYFTDNVCEIDLNLVHTTDVEKVRLLARRNNDTTFFVVDEFDPNANLFRPLFGTNTKIYDKGLGRYKFFNEQRSSSVSNVLTDKIFDNVPLKAAGQALAGNRLFYSDYTEGFENTKITSTVNVNYDDLSADGSGSIIFADTEKAFLIEDTNNASLPGVNTYRIKLDFDGPSYFNSGSNIVPGGSLLKMSFDFRPELKFSAGGGTGYTEVFTGSASTAGNAQQGVAAGSYTIKVGLPNSSETRIPINTITSQVNTFSTSYANPESQALSTFVTNFLTFLDQELENQFSDYEVTYNIVSGDGCKAEITSVQSGTLNVGDRFSVFGSITIKWGFTVAAGADNTELLIKPFIKSATQDLEMNAANSSNEGNIVGSFGLDSWSAGNQEAMTIHALSSQADQIDPNIYGTDADADATEFCSWRSFTANKTFKAGCSHDIGLVYYDEFNRNSFVNKVGSFYVDSLGERAAASNSNYGPANIDVSITNDPPPWAKSWQLVYGGMSTFSDYVQYTTGDAFPVRDSDGELLTERKQLYVSLDTIGNFKTEKNGDKSYSFTEGDKLRVVKYADDNSTVSWNYPLASDSVSFIEFNVVGFEILGGKDNPIAGEERALAEDYTITGGFTASGLATIDSIASDSVTVTRDGTDVTSSVNPPSFKNIEIQGSSTVVSAQVLHAGGQLRSGDVLTVNLPDYGSLTNPSFTLTLTKGILGGVSEEHQGEFIVIDAPQVSAGMADAGGSNEIKYNGFDWFSVTDTNYPDSNAPSTSSKWGHLSVVEILTPRTTEMSVYYEIGERQRIGAWKDLTLGPHGPALYVRSGDSYYRTSAANGPKYLSSSWNTQHPDEWGYTNVELESLSYSDYFPSRAWDKGRPHIVFENAAEVRRFNGITYSDPYAEDVANLSLSSFNPSLGNFDSVDSRFGALEYIGNYNDDLVGLQENKLCLIPVKKNIIEYASGSSDVAVSTNVLGQRRYSAGDYGSGGHPEAVLVQDNSVYFVDESRQAVCALTGGQLVPISEKGMSSFFEDFFTNSHTRYVSGYDPRVNTFYLTGLGGTDETVGYDVARGAWQSKYSFTPDVYANQNNMLYSANYISGNNIFWKHDSSTYNTFYGTAADSVVQVVSKISPSRVKIFKAMSYEGDAGNWDVVGDADIKTDLNQETGDITSWRENEGSYYAAIPRDKSSNSTSEEVHIGDLTLSSDTTYTVAGANLNRLHIPLNVDLTIAGDTRQVTSYTSNTITFDTALSSPGTNMKLEIAGEGDVIRGHFSKIKLTLPAASATTKQELYCINTHIADSKSHHPLGQ